MSTATVAGSRMALDLAWDQRLKLHVEGSNLYSEGYRIYAKGSKLHIDGDSLRNKGSEFRIEADRLYADGDQLHVEGAAFWAKGSQLFIEGRKVWEDAIRQVYGYIDYEWAADGSCILDNGAIFTTK